MVQARAATAESLSRLKGGRDADLIERPLVSLHRNRGAGAQSNVAGRFEKQTRESFDDGWTDSDPLALFKVTEHLEKARTIITRNESPDIPFDRSVNVYRGCAHGCSYCFARQSHAYVGLSAGLDFEREIFFKPNAAALLAREIGAARYKVQPIAMGTNTDPYQPLERKHKLTRQVLEVLAAHDHPVSIVTKSALVVRDLDLLAPMAAKGLVSVAISVTSMDRQLSRRMEPQASTPEKRLEAIRLLAAAGVPVGVMAAPMIPAINDLELERILDAARAQGASFVGMILLRLPGEVREVFREWLLRHYPDKLRHVLSLIRDMRGGRDNDPRFGSRFVGQGPYATLLQQRFEKARTRLGFDKRHRPLRCDLFSAPKIESPQLSLF